MVHRIDRIDLFSFYVRKLSPILFVWEPRRGLLQNAGKETGCSGRRASSGQNFNLRFPIFCFQDSLQNFQFWHARRDLFFALYPRGYQPEEMWVWGRWLTRSFILSSSYLFFCKRQKNLKKLYFLLLKVPSGQIRSA
jgi:hypothetical protein